MIAATDGVMTQTKEHLLLAKQVGVSSIIVFINKVDLVDNDVVTLVEIEARELLEHYGYTGYFCSIFQSTSISVKMIRRYTKQKVNKITSYFTRKTLLD